MNLGKRLRKIRMFRQLTQQALGEMLGFKDNSRDIRIAQYENGQRVPKSEILGRLSKALGGAEEAINIPSINDTTELMHLLFAMEDFFDLKINELDNKVCLTFDGEVEPLLSEWYEKYKALRIGDISENEYKNWQYNYKKQR